MLQGAASFSQLSGFLLFLCGVLTIICTIVIFFTLRQRDSVSRLAEDYRHALKIIESLSGRNTAIEMENDNLSKVHNESYRFYGMLLQAADDGICFYDSEGNLKYANSAFYSMLGLDHISYNAISPKDLLHPDDSDYPDRRKKALAEKGSYECELRLLHRNGNYVPLSTKSVSVKTDDDITIGALTISRDISKLKQANADLIKAGKEAEESNRLKSGFLANISHEIRTPLNSVVGFSNLLLSDDITPEARQEYVGHINYNSEKLLQIIGDIIDLSRLESSQIEIRYEETSLNSIIDEISVETRDIIKRNEKPIVLNVRNSFFDKGDLIFTDRLWLKRVLSHLMDNAVKFTLEGSVELICDLESGKMVFRIKDTGVGIKKENLSRIFEEFNQESAGYHRPFDGLGVGLTLAKEVIERMGGRIFVQSEKGMGSEFGFSLPYRPAGGSAKFQSKNPSGEFTPGIDWSSRKCLVIDNNKDTLVYIKKMLHETGINIITARSGPEAMQITKFTPDIDVALLNMQMPGTNSIELTRELRNIKQKLPIIGQTAFIFKDEKDIILEAGCDACIIKPVRRENLISALQGFLSS